jgi:RND family efflux transporter MFP subunit
MLIEIRPKDSQMQIDGAESLLSSATTPQARAEAERTLALARSVDNVARVAAPIGGVVSARTVNAGEIVAEGADMLSIVDLSSIVFTADMPLSVMTDVRVGIRCRVRLQAMPDTLLDAILSAVSPQAESQSQSVPVRFEFRGLSPSVRAALKSDMNGTAIVVVGTDRHALVVPSAAVLRDDRDDSFTVVVVGSDSTARIVPVQVIARRDSVVEVRGDGLSEGSDVVVEGNYALPDSTRIRVVR